MTTKEDKKEIESHVKGQKVVELTFEHFPWGDRWIGLVLENGTEIMADGGEDSRGGYGFLELDKGLDNVNP